MNSKIQKFQKAGKLIQLWGNISKGIKNLQLYRSYVKDPKRFIDPVQKTFDHYTSRFPVLQTNYFPKVTRQIPQSQWTMPKITTGFTLDGSSGLYFNRTNKIKLNPYSWRYLKYAWESPKLAIQGMKNVAAHEAFHSIANQSKMQLTKWSPKIGYYTARRGNPIYDELTYAFDSRKDSWTKSPEEFIADLSLARYDLGEKPGVGFSQWNPDNQRRTVNYLSQGFDFSPEDTEYLLHRFSQLGFKQGGKIENPDH